MIRRYIQAFAVLALVACNKEIETKKAINVTFHGYNISNMKMEIAVDTVVFDKDILPENKRIGFSKVYPYFGNKRETILHVKDQESGKELFQKTLPLSTSQLEFFFPLININGTLLEVTPPKADPATNKLCFYIYYTESNDPIDILMYNQNTGQQLYLAQNVVPQTWVYTDYLPTEGFMTKNEVESCTIYFLKAGTLDQWAFDNDEYLSQTGAFGWYIPHAKFSLNKVQPYFILPQPQGWGAEAVPLFPIPREY